MDLTNQTELELHFADHFDTVLFPVLAEMYLSKGDFSRAKKVCEIGLNHHPGNCDGQFIFAQAELGLGHLSEAERMMKKVLHTTPDHHSAAGILPIIQEQLGRAQATIRASWKRVLVLDPKNKLAKDYLKKKKSVSKNQKIKKPGPSPKKNITLHHPELTLDGMNITPRLATFTFVAVLRNQGLFHQALDVLEVMEKKGEDKKKIAEERKAIKAEIQP